jgi:aspartate-semialdehyde dehydrogenase
MKEYNVAVCGATGVVGREMLKVLEQRDFPLKNLLPLASERSIGKEIEFKGRKIKVGLLRPEAFSGIDYALFSAGSDISLKIAPEAAKRGAVVIDNSSAFRMDDNVPLVVPEVNPEDAFKHQGIIANPNCSTIQMVVVLKPIDMAFKIKRVVAATYQSVSGWGKGAVDQLWKEVAKIKDSGEARVDLEERVLPSQIAFNLFPHIDNFREDGYTKEELKMANETEKIMHGDFSVTATCVRVPVLVSHSEAVNIELERDADPDKVREILKDSPGVKVIDDASKGGYPMPLYAAGSDHTFVGRIRKDSSVKSGIWVWIVSDNLRKGAALNAVQIAELLAKNDC